VLYKFKTYLSQMDTERDGVSPPTTPPIQLLLQNISRIEPLIFILHNISNAPLFISYLFFFNGSTPSNIHTLEILFFPYRRCWSLPWLTTAGIIITQTYLYRNIERCSAWSVVILWFVSTPHPNEITSYALDTLWIDF
jgi:hypothetical protein